MSRKLDPFESPKRRLRRGKEHARRLEKRIQTFLKKEPYKRVEDVDAEGFATHAIKFTRDFPDSWVDAAVESIEALRSTLDQAGYAAAILGGVTDPKNAYFPIADKITDLDGVVKGRCRDIPAEIKTLFRGFDAHEGGNYALWALNKLCGANKHRLLIPIGALAPSVKLGSAMLQGGGEIFPPRWNREKHQIEFARINPGGQFKYDAQITFFIGFDEFNGVKPAPAVGVIDLIAAEVGKVITATENKCRETGLI